MMNAWEWFVVIAGSIIFAVVFIIAFFALLPKLLEKLTRMKYAREAKAHNKKARELRLEKTEINGFPLPQGQEGQLSFPLSELYARNNAVTVKQYHRALEHRAEDLWIDYEWSEDVIRGTFSIRWRPRKDRRPKEVY